MFLEEKGRKNQNSTSTSKSPFSFKTIIILLLEIFLLFSLFGFSVLANPENDPDDECHESGPYSISTTSDLTLNAARGKNFTITINAEGPCVIVRFHELILDNQYFSVKPTDIIEDNSDFDSNNQNDKISIEFTFKAPNQKGTYEIMIYAKSPDGYTAGKPYLAELVFQINVDEAGFVFTLNSIIKAFFNHHNIYLGSIGIACLTAATVLSEIDYRKYHKSHAYLSFGALTATGINTYFILTESWNISVYWLETLFIEWWHFFHIILGIVGFIFCAFGAISGMSGIRHKKSGYIALACWGFNFGFGLLYWGVGLG